MRQALSSFYLLPVVLLITCIKFTFSYGQEYYLNRLYHDEPKVIWINAMSFSEGEKFSLLNENTINNFQGSLSVCKIDAQGNILDSLWMRVDSIFLSGQYLDRTEDGKLIIIGTYLDNRDSELICPMWIEVDMERKQYEIKTFCNEHKRGIRNITQLSNGIYASTGLTNKNGKAQIMLIVFDESGKIVVEREYGDGPWHEAFGSVVEHPDGGLVIGGWIMQNHPFLINFDMLILRLDQNYNLLWSKQIGAEDDDGEGAPLNIDPNGHIIITSMRSRLEDNRLKIDPYFARLHKQDGRILTERTYPQERNSSFYGQPYIFENGDVVVAGYRRVFIEHINFSTIHTSITKMNSSGDILWDRVIVYIHDGSNLTGLGKPIYHEDGFFWVYGYSKPYNERQNAWLIKLDSMGCPFPGCDTITVSVDPQYPVEEQSRIVAYPNPFGEHLTVRYAFPKPVPSPTLLVLDMTGRTICAIPLNGHAPQGDAFIDSSRWPPGLYSMQIQSEGKVIGQTKGVRK